MATSSLASAGSGPGDIIHLNVGGQRFSTSRHTLTWIPDTFFTSLLSGRISTLRDESNAIFIDRDPSLFTIILNYLRTKDINIDKIDINSLRHEAEYYGIAPLVKRLMLCQDLNHSACGDVLFCGYLAPPNIPVQDSALPSSSEMLKEKGNSGGSGVPSGTSHISGATSGNGNSRQGHSRNPSLEMRFNGQGHYNGSHPLYSTHSSRGSADPRRTHSRNPSLDLRHSRNSSADLNKYFKSEISILNSVGPSGREGFISKTKYL